MIGYFKSIEAILLCAIGKYKCKQYHPDTQTTGVSDPPWPSSDCAPSL